MIFHFLAKNLPNVKTKKNASVYCFFLKPSINSFGPQQKKSQIISLVLIMNIKNQDSVGLKSPVCLFVSVCPSVCLCVILCVCMSFCVSVCFWVFLSCVCPEEQESGSGCSLECRSQQPAAQNWPEMGISLSGIQFRGDAQFIFLQIFIKNYILEYFTGRNFVKLELLFIILVHDRPTSVKSRLLELYLVPHLLPRLPGHICPILEPPYVQLAIVMFAFFWVINSQSVPSTMSQQHQYNFERHIRLWNKSHWRLMVWQCYNCHIQQWWNWNYGLEGAPNKSNRGERSLRVKIPIWRCFWCLITNWDSRSKRAQGHSSTLKFPPDVLHFASLSCIYVCFWTLSCFNENLHAAIHYALP